MIAKILEYLQKQCTDIHFVIGAFILVWLGAWLANGLVGTKMDIGALSNFFWGIIAKYGFDSTFNSDKGVKP